MLVSVIVPIYNVEKYLHKCIDSILEQTYTNLEIILVDDGSPDNCGAICDEYTKKDDRIKVIHKENGGLSDARNAGIDIATGEYIMLVDGDDYLDSLAVETFCQRLIQDNSDLAICNMCCIAEDGQVMMAMNNSFSTEDAIHSSEEALELMCTARHYYITAANRMYRRKLFENLRFPKAKLHEDAFTAHHFVAQCEKISYIGTPLYFYLQREKSLTHQRYTVKRLDDVEASLDRMSFVFERGLFKAAEQTASFIMKEFQIAYFYLNLKHPQNKKRFAELKQAFKYDYIHKVWNVATLCSKLYFVVFCFNVGFCSVLVKYFNKAKSLIMHLSKKFKRG